MNRTLSFILLAVLFSLWPEMGFCEISGPDVLELQHQNELLHSRNNVNFLATLMLMALVMMLFIWNIKKTNRRHMLQLQRKNNALQLEHDRAVKAREAAENASEMKTRFIHQMTHEIRTPLNAISGFSQLLANPDVNYGKEEKQQMCGLVMESTQHLTDMLNDIIILAELDGNTFGVNTGQTTSLKEFVSSIGNINELTMSVSDFDGGMTKATGDEKFITDVTHLCTAVQNVVNNAIKFGDTSKVKILLAEGLLTIEVTDNGPGVSVEDRKNLFQRFYKKDPFIPGVGLGLCVSRAILESLGGNVIYDETYEGKGACFIISCPVVLS